MKPSKILEVFNKYDSRWQRERIPELVIEFKQINQKPSDRFPRTVESHCLQMIPKIEEFLVSKRYGKAHRWVGFIRGAMTINGHTGFQITQMSMGIEGDLSFFKNMLNDLEVVPMQADLHSKIKRTQQPNDDLIFQFCRQLIKGAQELIVQKDWNRVYLTLGDIQGIQWAMGEYSIFELMNHNRPG